MSTSFFFSPIFPSGLPFDTFFTHFPLEANFFDVQPLFYKNTVPPFVILV